MCVVANDNVNNPSFLFYSTHWNKGFDALSFGTYSCDSQLEQALPWGVQEICCRNVLLQPINDDL